MTYINNFVKQEIRLNIPAEIEHVVEVREVLRDVCDEMGFTPHDASLVITAVWEATLNAATHGSPGGETDYVQVLIRRGDRELAIDITSKNPAFDLPDEMPKFDVTSRRGRGLPIIYAFMDEVKLTRGPDGVTLHLTKRIPLA